MPTHEYGTKHAHGDAVEIGPLLATIRKLDLLDSPQEYSFWAQEITAILRLCNLVKEAEDGTMKFKDIMIIVTSRKLRNEYRECFLVDPVRGNYPVWTKFKEAFSGR